MVKRRGATRAVTKRVTASRALPRGTYFKRCIRSSIPLSISFQIVFNTWPNSTEELVEVRFFINPYDSVASRLDPAEQDDFMCPRYCRLREMVS